MLRDEAMCESGEAMTVYSPRVAQERIRTARKLEELPELTAALEEHELPFSAVRELSRIATPATERAWRGAARGKSLREIEELVSGRAEGDLPTNRRRPELEASRLSYERPISPTNSLRRRQCPYPAGQSVQACPASCGRSRISRGRTSPTNSYVRWTIQPGPTHGIALQRRNLPPMELASRDAAKTRFTGVGAPLEVRFERDASGRVTGFVIDSGDITGIRFVKLR